MMDKNEIQQDGLPEDYALGLLNEQEAAAFMQQAGRRPDISGQLASYEKALLHYLEQFAVPVADREKQKLFSIIDQLEEEQLQTDSFPLIHKYADSNEWLARVKTHLDKMPDTYFAIQTLHDDNKVNISLVRTYNDVPEEIHHDLHESFLVLQGTCSCVIGEETYHLKAGDYLEIPLHADHNVIVTSKEPVIAILQRLAA